MRISVSNIAWDPAEDKSIAVLLNRFNIDAIDIALSKYFPDPSKVTDKEIALLKHSWSDQGIEIIGLQSLLFGTTGLNIFGNPSVQFEMLQHLTDICRVSAGLGAQKLVFGSPKNRDRTGLSDIEALNIAVPFFRRLGDIAQSYGVKICLEPNPPCYGANFMTTSAETAKIVTEVDHNAIRMQFDSGALTINNENVFSVLQNWSPLIEHIHISEPNLLPLGDGGGYIQL